MQNTEQILQQIIYNLQSIEGINGSEIEMPEKRIEYEDCIRRALEELEQAKTIVVNHQNGLGIKPKMALPVRISQDQTQKQRYTEEQIKSEITNKNVQIGGDSGTILIRKSDGAIMGEFLI